MVLTLALTAALLPADCRAAVTTSETPQVLYGTSLKWEKNMGSGTGNSMIRNMPTPPVIEGSSLYIGQKDHIYKINKGSGKTTDSSEDLDGDMGYATQPLTYEDGRIFAALNKVKNGNRYTSVVCLDADTLDLLWESTDVRGQNVCPVTVIDGRVYTGTWWQKYESGEAVSQGTYFCLDAETAKTSEDQKPVWKTDEDDSFGFYWAGAVEISDRIVFGGDTGILYSVDKNALEYSDQTVKTTSALCDGSNEVIRSTPAVNGSDLYVVTKESKQLCKFSLTDSGAFQEDDTCVLDQESTSTPVVEPNSSRLYFGTESGSIYSVDLNASSLDADQAVICSTDYGWKAPGPVKAELLVSVGRTGKICIYTSYNKKPGGIYYLEMNAAGTAFQKGGTLFVPAQREYCICPITADEDGTLYYKNDTGYLMAVVSGSTKPEKPSGLKVKHITYNSVQLTWNYSVNAAYYLVEYKVGKNNWKKVQVRGRSYVKKQLKTGHKYSFRIRAVSGAGTKSSPTAVKSAIPYLKAPSSVRTSARKRAVKVSWKRVSGASGYQVFRSSKKSKGYRIVKSVKKTSCVSSKLKKGKRYYFKVRAYRKTDGKRVYGKWSKISPATAK